MLNGFVSIACGHLLGSIPSAYIVISTPFFLLALRERFKCAHAVSCSYSNLCWLEKLAGNERGAGNAREPPQKNYRAKPEKPGSIVLI